MFSVQHSNEETSVFDLGVTHWHQSTESVLLKKYPRFTKVYKTFLKTFSVKTLVYTVLNIQKDF